MSRTRPEHARRCSLPVPGRVRAHGGGAVPYGVLLAVLAASAAVAGPAAAASAAAPAALPGEPGAGGVVVTPREARPGDRLELRAGDCGGAGTASAASAAFGSAAALEPAAEGELTGMARVRADAAPGRYVVEVDCGGDGAGADGAGGTDRAVRTAPERGAAVVTVVGRDGPDAPRPAEQPPDHPAEPPATPTAAPADQPAPHTSPVAPVRAGGGATAAAPDPGGPGPAAVGACLVGAAALLGAARAVPRVRHRAARRAADGR
ncbi:hypothetical protein [Streptomyces phytohabitans]|uniref:hypothetical protein n=1 Tax=Streptomyces phytohabitans TaxID=1150371 RepID=UPI00345BEA06